MTIATTIDVFSDVVCPWCYLGKRRLAEAQRMLPDYAVTVHWRAFRLDPTIPEGGIDRDTYITQKFGSLDAIDASHNRLTDMGKAEGIDYHFERIRRSPNTIDAHRLVRWAAADDRQEAMVERLFAAYFSEGRDVGDRATLAELAGEVGVTGDIAARLASDAGRDAVTAEIDNAYRIGVTGVPCFVIDRRFGVMGAQTADIIADAIRRAAAAPAGATALV